MNVYMYKVRCQVQHTEPWQWTD